jgi:hypothetical protein
MVFKRVTFPLWNSIRKTAMCHITIKYPQVTQRLIIRVESPCIINHQNYQFLDSK